MDCQLCLCASVEALDVFPFETPIVDVVDYFFHHVQTMMEILITPLHFRIIMFGYKIL